MTEEWKCSTRVGPQHLTRKHHCEAGGNLTRVQHVSLSPLISASCYEVIPDILAGQTVIPSAFLGRILSLTTWSQSCKVHKAQGTE